MKRFVRWLKRVESDGWDEVIAEYDQYSVREFLELNGWSEGMIEMFGLLNNQESVMNSSFLELFREDGGNYYTNMCQIVGRDGSSASCVSACTWITHPLWREDDRHGSVSR